MRQAIWVLCLLVSLGGTIGDATALEPPDIVREWTTVTPPPAPPSLSEATVVPETTALLLIAFDKNICNSQMRARCPPTVPKVRTLLKAARDSHMLVLHAHNEVTKDSDIVPELAPMSGEIVFRSGPDKFLGTSLERILKDRGVTTVILAGTAGNGAVLFTLIGGVSRGLDFLVPIDAIPADGPYHEQFAIFEMADVMFLRAHTTLTRSELINFPK